MSANHVAVAVDLGASSGRLVGGVFDGERLSLEDIHRFENGPVRASNRMYWDVLGLWREIQTGMGKANSNFGDQVQSIGVDTWGVDFGLLGKDGLLLANPFHYRDSHTEGIFERAFSIVSREDIFASSGLQFMPFNSLFQLLAMKQANSSALEAADSLLMMPDLFHWLMTGIRSNEQTNASTTQFLNPETGDWANDLLERFDLPTNLLGEISLPGTVLGEVSAEVAADTGMNGTKVVLPGTHDTASAVMAVPAEPAVNPNWCYISSGTWSLMGIEVARPIVTDRCRALNFTNEGGVGGTIRLLKNIGGLWLIQECRRIWQKEGKSFSFQELVQAAENARPLVSFIDPDHSDFMAPDHMPRAIASYCERTGQTAPNDVGAVIRCALESLALRYRSVLESLEELGGTSIETIHIVGGGTQNELLNQMAADACGREVIAGPVEATAIGNALMQLIALGQIDSIPSAREIVRNSFPVKRYQPSAEAAWDGAYEQFRKLIS